jgi:hypothetical protein
MATEKPLNPLNGSEVPQLGGRFFDPQHGRRLMRIQLFQVPQNQHFPIGRIKLLQGGVDAIQQLPMNQLSEVTDSTAI